MTDAEIDYMLAHPIPQERPWGTSVRYDAARDAVHLELDGGATLVMPRAAIDELRDLPKSHMRELALGPGGHALSLRRDDVDVYVPGLVRDLIGFGQRAFHPDQLPKRRRTSRRSAPVPQNGARKRR
jgi:hypothetical protein